MMLALKIGLVLLAVVALVILVIVGWFINVLKKAVKSAAESVAAAQPCRVTLKPESNPEWRTPDVINRYAGDLRAIGFEEVGTFSIPELGGMMILGLVHPTEGLLSVVYDHRRQKAPTFDIVADYADGSSVSATNSSAGDALDKRPNHPILWLGDSVSASDVLERVQKFEAPAARQPIRKEDFAEHFKKGYARSINWRLKKGGASRDEVRRQAAKKGQQLTDEQVENVYQKLHHRYLRQLQEGCIAQYLDDQKPAAGEWERIRPQTFAIAETLELKEIIATISEYVDLDEEQTHQLEKIEKNFGEDATVVMNRILDQNIASLGVKKLGEVAEPVRALILLSPTTVDVDGEVVDDEATKD